MYIDCIGTIYFNGYKIIYVQLVRKLVDIAVFEWSLADDFN